MIEKLVLPEIRELIEKRDAATLSDVINEWLPPDIAGLVTSLDDPEQDFLFRALEPSRASAIFEYLDLPTQERLLASIPPEEIGRILDDMSPDDRTALLEELEPENVDRLLGLLTPEQREIARSLLRHGEDTVGRLMTTDFLAIRQEWTIKRVLDHIRAHGKDSETLNVVYVIDDLNHLTDDLRIREVLLAPLHAHVRDLMNHQYVTLRATDGKKEAVAVFRKYDRTALPVVDAQGRLVGIVTIDDVLDVAEQETTRALQQFGGLEALDESYVDTPLPLMIRKRATWLVVLFLGEMLTATAMGFFEGEIQKAVVLALFVPLIISSGGNSGSQAATLIIRALALQEVTLRDWWTVMRRELVSGVMLGALLGTIGNVHSGFNREVDDLWPALEDWLRTDERPVWFCGHSLGAAMATISIPGMSA